MHGEHATLTLDIYPERLVNVKFHRFPSVAEQKERRKIWIRQSSEHQSCDFWLFYRVMIVRQFS